MDASTLQVTWYLLFGVLIIGYAILDGFDLGVGVLSLFGRRGEERRKYLNAIGPVWDGNEVWLITAGGALFAAFPPVYATVFSGFYLALVLVLLGLIFRAVSIEFRSKLAHPRWQAFWDWGFGLGSLLPALLFGVAVGNVLRGVPLDERGEYAGSFFTLLNPYSLVMGVLSLVMFVCHGAIYMAIKSEGKLRDTMLRWALGAWIAWALLYAAATALTAQVSPWLFLGHLTSPLFWTIFSLFLISLLAVPLALRARRTSIAFLASSLAIATMIGLPALGLFPRLLPALGDPDAGLTVMNASSTPTTLWTMFLIALIGMPVVILYTVIIHRVFKGKVEIGEESY